MDHVRTDLVVVKFGHVLVLGVDYLLARGALPIYQKRDNGMQWDAQQVI
jgi:hypothetical protein